MKKRIVLFLGAGFLTLITACSSPEEKEVLTYHNDFVDYTNPKLEEIEDLDDKIEKADTKEEAYDIEDNEIIPLIKDIKDYFDEQEPEEEVTKKYHELRSSWADKYYEGFQVEDEAYEALLGESGEEADDLFADADGKLEEASEDLEKANEEWDAIVDEYNINEKSE